MQAVFGWFLWKVHLVKISSFSSTTLLLANELKSFPRTLAALHRSVSANVYLRLRSGYYVHIHNSKNQTNQFTERIDSVFDFVLKGERTLKKL